MSAPAETGVAASPDREHSDSLLARQRRLWLTQASSVPSLQCGKDEVLPRLLELLQRVRSGEAHDLSASPQLAVGETKGTWQQFGAALRALGLVENQRGVLSLTSDGEAFLSDSAPSHLATLLVDRTRLVAEALELVLSEPRTVQEVHDELVSAYDLDWTTLNNTRVRLTWLEVLGLVEWLGGNKLTATRAGKEVFPRLNTVTPTALTFEQAIDDAILPDAPPEIAALLERLSTDASRHDARKTYNIWVPSPPSDPNKIDNMRACIARAAESVEREEFLTFISGRFSLKRSSVDSMLPFMRAGGFLQEVRRGHFAATPEAKAWLDSGSDIDFIRILHGNMRFVGELIDAAQVSVPRSELYREGAPYGMNKEKIRWLIAFMIEAGLLRETSWSAVEATPTGRLLVNRLPLAERPLVSEAPSSVASRAMAGEPDEKGNPSGRAEGLRIARELVRSANDPSADGLTSGSAFETNVEVAFQFAGFRSHRISGSGDTDVLVRWYDKDQVLRTAIVDAKSTASGQISHTSVSDVAISTHKEKHAADFVAIVAPSFAGETIRDMAAKKKWALISAAELGEVVASSHALGLRPADIGVVFEVPDGLSRVAGVIDARQRELDLMSLVVSRLNDELETGEVVSPRDIEMLERTSDLSPSLDELISTFTLLLQLDADIVRVAGAASDPRHETYQLGDVRSAAGKLRALADALERGLGLESA